MEPESINEKSESVTEESKNSGNGYWLGGAIGAIVGVILASLFGSDNWHWWMSTGGVVGSIIGNQISPDF